MKFGVLSYFSAAWGRAFLGLVAWAGIATTVFAQAPATAAPAASSGTAQVHRAVTTLGGSNVSDDGSTITDYIPDLSQGQSEAFYNGIKLGFAFCLSVGLFWYSRQQMQTMKRLRQQANLLRSDAEQRQKDFLRKQHIHFENTPLVVVEINAARQFKEWTGRAEAVFGWRAMEVTGRAVDALPWVDEPGIAAVRAAFTGVSGGAPLAGRIVTLRHQARNGEVRLVEWHISVIPTDDGAQENILALGLDVTEREAAAANLRREQKHYALAVHAGSAGLWSLDPAIGHLHWEEHLAEMLGYKAAEFPARLNRWLELFHPEDRPLLEEALSACMNERSARQIIEARLRHRDGAYRWFRLGFFLEASLGKGNEQITGTATDLTRLKLAEEKFRGLVEQSLAGIFILQENRVVYANPKFWSIVRSGGSRPPLRPEFLELVHPEDRATIAERLRPLYAGTGHEAALLFRLSGAQGHAVAVQGHGISSEHEGAPAILGLVMDVSHRFAQEQTSRRLSQVVEQSPVAILITNPDGVIEYANRKFCEVSGYPQEELLGQTPELLKSSQTPEDFYRDLLARLREGKKWEGEYINRAKDGRQFTVRANLFPIFDEGGAVTHYVEIMEDITNQRSLEERLGRAQRLESIGNLAGGIAHDLNNILAPVRLGAEFLKTLPFSGKEREIIEVIDISIHRATELVLQVLAFSRGRSGKRDVIALREIIGELERLVRESFPRDVRLDVRLDSDLEPVKADATQILQVLMNLCVNGRDAMPGGGVIRLIADNVVLGSAQTASFPGAKPGRHVRIRVSDTGTGIPMQIRDKIFEPFYTTKDVGKGTGLGLSTALGIVQEHAGIIELESSGSDGTTFVIYLPVTTEPLPPPAVRASMTPFPRPIASSAPNNAAPGNGKKVLVVDDEGPLRQAIALVLGQCGYTVLQASDGYKAIELMRERGGEVDVVLLDVMMPRLDGVDTLKALREMRADVRVVATSGVSHDARVEAMRKMGVEHFLLKPYRNRELVSALEACVAMEPGQPI